VLQISASPAFAAFFASRPAITTRSIVSGSWAVYDRSLASRSFRPVEAGDGSFRYVTLAVFRGEGRRRDEYAMRRLP
jgi:hypothetical protein